MRVRLPPPPRCFELVSAGQRACDLRSRVAVDADLTRRNARTANRRRFGLSGGDLDTSRSAVWASGIGDLAAVQTTAERVIIHARKILNGLDT